ncbi:MAG: hypothetical protein NTX49_05295 [Chlamydiae bacterium]|nr:hypothetical protein [Chlamydiota bacterium]
MRKIEFSFLTLPLLCLFSSLYSSDSTWSIPAIIDNTTSTSNSSVFTSYCSASNQVFATWSDFNNSSHPTYSIASYANGAWSWATPATISDTSQAQNNLFTCYIRQTNQVFAAWLDTNNSNYPTYSIASYSNNTWTWLDPHTIEQTPTTTTNCNTFLCYASQTNQIFATISDGTTSYPKYSIASYNGSSWSWSAFARLDGISTSTVSNNLFTSYNSITNQVFATWVASNNNYYPTYSIGSYLGGNWTWTTPAVIDNTTISGDWNVFTSFNPNTNQIFAIWYSDATKLPHFSIASYVGGNWTWSPPAVIGTNGSQAQFTPSICCDTVNNRIIATWADPNNSENPTYSIATYSGGVWSWSEPSIISASGNSVNTSVFNSYDPETNQVFATWGHNSTPLPYFSIFDLPSSAFPRSFGRPNNRRSP